MFSIKLLSHKKQRRGEIAATLTVLAMFVLTIGVLFGASLVNQTSPASQTEAFGVSGVTPVESTTGFSIDYTRIDPARSINPKQAILYGTICFDENPPLNGRFKIEVYAVKTGDPTRVLAGSSVEKTATSPQTLRCRGGRPTSFGAVFTKLPEGFTADNLDKYHVTLHTSNGWEDSGIGVDTDIATIAKTAVGSLQSQGQAESSPTPSLTPSPTLSPTPTIPLPPANKCMEGCTKTDPSGNPTTFDSICGEGLECKWAGIGTPRPDQERCLDMAAGCKCVPPNVSITDKCNSKSCVCGGLKMCEGRIEVSGLVELNDNVPKDDSGNPLRVKVILCQAVTVAGVSQCSPSQTTGNKEVLVTKANPNFKFERLPQAKYGVYLAQKLVNNNDNSDSALTVPTDTKVTIDTSTCKPETDAADPQVKKVEASIKDFASPTSHSQVCYVEVLNGASPSCKAETGIKIKTEIPQPTSTPVPTNTPIPTNTPSPTPKSEADRTLKFQFEIKNYTSYILSEPVRCDDRGACLIERDENNNPKFQDGYPIKSIKYEVCSVMPSGDNSTNCSGIKSVDLGSLGPVNASGSNGNPARKDSDPYVLTPYALKPIIRNCRVEFTDGKGFNCAFKDPSQTPPPASGGDNRTPSNPDNSKWYLNIRVWGLSGGGVKPLPYFASQTEASDVSGNSCVNVDDYSRLVLAYGKTDGSINNLNPAFFEESADIELPEDINYDGIVNAFDMAILLSNLGTGSGCAFNQ